MDIVTGEDENPARDANVCQDASTLSRDIATIRTNYRKAAAQVPYTAASWKYITEETTDMDLCNHTYSSGRRFNKGICRRTLHGYNNIWRERVACAGRFERWRAMLASGFSMRTMAGRMRTGLSSPAFLQMAPGVNGRRQPDRGAFPS